MAECLFCRIVAKEIPSKVVYEDKQVLAFHDINPAAPVHVLIVPKQHRTSLLDVTPDDQAVLGHLQLVAGQLAREFGLEERGFRLVSNCGEEGGQTIGHLHFHLLGGRTLQWPPG